MMLIKFKKKVTFDSVLSHGEKRNMETMRVPVAPHPAQSTSVQCLGSAKPSCTTLSSLTLDRELT